MTFGLRVNIFVRSLLLQAVWNFERMQTTGFGLAIEPWLRRVWNRPEALREARRRAADFFNTQPYMAGFAVGLACRLEKEMAVSAPGRRPEIAAQGRHLKKLLGPALAALGDAFFWGALRPAMAVLAVWIYLAADRCGLRPAWLWAAGAYLVPYNAAALGMRWWGLEVGWAQGPQLVRTLQRLPIKTAAPRIRLAGTILGLTLVLAVVFDPAGLGPIEALAVAAAGAGLMRFGAGVKAVYGGAFAVAVAAAAMGMKIG